MNKSVIVINGSAREGGNTDALLDKFEAGAQNYESGVVHFRLRDLNIGDCQGCYLCREKSECGQDDDMTAIRKAIQDSGLLIFASPLYWCEVTGLMKTFIDRLYFYYHPNTKSLISDKKAIIICPLGETENIEHETELMIEFNRRAFRSLEIELLDIMLFPGLYEDRDNYKKPKYLDSMKQLGMQLKSLL